MHNQPAISKAFAQNRKEPADPADDKPSALSKLSLAERCAFGHVVGRHLANVAEWREGGHVQRALSGNRLEMVIVDNDAFSWLSNLIRENESCESRSITTERGRRKITINLVNGCGPEIGDKLYVVGNAYDQEPGSWQVRRRILEGMTGCEPLAPGEKRIVMPPHDIVLGSPALVFGVKRDKYGAFEVTYTYLDRRPRQQ